MEKITIDDLLDKEEALKHFAIMEMWRNDSHILNYFEDKLISQLRNLNLIDPFTNEPITNCQYNCLLEKTLFYDMSEGKWLQINHDLILSMQRVIKLNEEFFNLLPNFSKKKKKEIELHVFSGEIIDSVIIETIKAANYIYQLFKNVVRSNPEGLKKKLTAYFLKCTNHCDQYEEKEIIKPILKLIK
jgi:hypothetical protein